MSDSIELRNRVPSLERWIAVFFVLVGAPLTFLGWTQSEELPALLAPVVQIGFPLFLIAVLWYAFVQRKRVDVVLAPGASLALIEERVWWWRRTRESPVVSVDLEMTEDIDGDPYGKLVLRMPDSELLTISEGTDLERLRTELSRVSDWIESRR